MLPFSDCFHSVSSSRFFPFYSCGCPLSPLHLLFSPEVGEGLHYHFQADDYYIFSTPWALAYPNPKTSPLGYLKWSQTHRLLQVPHYRPSSQVVFSFCIFNNECFYPTQAWTWEWSYVPLSPWPFLSPFLINCQFMPILTSEVSL